MQNTFVITNLIIKNMDIFIKIMELNYKNYKK